MVLGWILCRSLVVGSGSVEAAVADPHTKKQSASGWKEWLEHFDLTGPLGRRVRTPARKLLLGSALSRTVLPLTLNCTNITLS